MGCLGMNFASLGYFEMLARERNFMRAAEKLPSTSPANAAFSIERLASAWAAVPLQVRDE